METKYIPHILTAIVIISLFSTIAQAGENVLQDLINLQEIETQKENPFQKYLQNPQVNFKITEEQKKTNLEEIKNALKESDNLNILVWLKENNKPEDITPNLKNFKVKYIYESSNGFAGTANKETIEQLAKDKRVDYLVLDKEGQGLLQQSRPLIQANLAENIYNITGNSVGVCVLDTGINYTNPYLINNYAGGYDLVNNDPNPMDDNGHGTRIAGVIASQSATRRGMAPNSKIIAIKVLNSNAIGSLSTIAAGVDWCVTNKNIYNISLISMSIGTIGGIYTPSTNPASYEPSLASAYNNNIPIVAASGNDGSTSGISYPAISPYVISVGATYDANIGPSTFSICTDTTTYAIPQFNGAWLNNNYHTNAKCWIWSNIRHIRRSTTRLRHNRTNAPKKPAALAVANQEYFSKHGKHRLR